MARRERMTGVSRTSGSIEGETPMQIPRTVREVIEKGPLAHLTTLNPNGSPQVTVVWVGIEDEEFVMGHLAMHQKVKNIRRDPRVALRWDLLSPAQSADRRRHGRLEEDRYLAHGCSLRDQACLCGRRLRYPSQSLAWPVL